MTECDRGVDRVQQEFRELTILEPLVIGRDVSYGVSPPRFSKYQSYQSIDTVGQKPEYIKQIFFKTRFHRKSITIKCMYIITASLKKQNINIVSYIIYPLGNPVRACRKKRLTRGVVDVKCCQTLWRGILHKNVGGPFRIGCVRKIALNENLRWEWPTSNTRIPRVRAETKIRVRYIMVGLNGSFLNSCNF